MYAVRECSNFILLHVDIVFPASFAEEPIPSVLCALDTLVEDQLTIYAWVYFWDLYSIVFVYVSVFMAVPYCFIYSSLVIYFEIGKCGVTNSVLSQDHFGYLGPFVIPMIFFSISVKNAIGGLPWWRSG